MENEKCKYKIKKKHLFQLSQMYDEMGIKIDTENLSKDEKQMQIQLGVQVIDNILKNLYRAEKTSDELLSSITKIEVKELQEMEAAEYMNLWEELLNDNTLSRFFKKALKSMQPRK